MKLADVSIKRPVLATVMIGVLIVFGIDAYPKIGVDLMPDIEFPFVTITAVYPGADPESVESKIVDKLEEAVNTVSSIKELRSTSMENVGFVIIRFELERNADQAVQDVRDKVSSVLAELPADLEPPIVQKFDINSAPIMAIALAGRRSTAELTELADRTVKQRLQTIAGVGGIDIVGGQDREFKVWVDPRKLSSYGLGVADVVQSLRMQNMDVPGGRLDTGTRELMVKTQGQLKNAEELRQVIISAAGGSPLHIGDVAEVQDGQVEKRSHSELDGQAAIALLVRKQSGTNTVQVAEKLREELDQLRKELPPDLSITVPNDNSIWIQQSIDGVKEDLVLGAALAVLIILFFMRDWRATLISALALPTSVIATLLFLKMFGFTFNVMTMLALSLSIGMLIDDAIVVIENIHRHLELGKPPLQAASEGVAEIGLAVLATTASIVAVFLPVATMKGIIGRFFLQFGVTVTVAVLISLFVAFTLTPMMSARMLKHGHRGKPNLLSRMITGLLDGITGAYRAMLGLVLRQRALTVLVAVAVFAGSLFLAGKVPFEFMPTEDRSQFKVSVELPTGTNLAVTEQYVSGISKKLREIPGIRSTFATIGGGSQGEVNKAEIQVDLVAKKERAFSQQEAINHVRQLFSREQEQGIRLAVEPVNSMGGGAGMRAAKIQFNLRGRDYEQLNTAAQQILEELKARGAYVDLDSTYRGGKPEVTVQIDRDRAADLGVPVALIATTLRTFFAGEKSGEILDRGERYDVQVQLDQEQRRSPRDIERLEVRSTTGVLVPLSNLIRIAEGEGAARIERQNSQRQVTVLANLEGLALGQATEEVEQLARKHLPAGLSSAWGGEAEIMQESVKSLAAALILAIIMVYLILAAQFESFLHPFTIMLSLPLSLVGAIGGLLIAGQMFSIFSMIGVIMLMGLVTKNAILLVDYTNTLREQGLSRREALLQAGPVRLRPILMTTAAMVFGMLPVALALSAGGEQRAPMAVAVIGGLITSTLLTLLVVPVAYDLLDGLKERLLGKKQVELPAPVPLPLHGGTAQSSATSLAALRERS